MISFPVSNKDFSETLLSFRMILADLTMGHLHSIECVSV